MLFFIYKYVFRLGFLDGVPGLIYCGFQAIQFFQTKAKIYELRSRRDSSEVMCGISGVVNCGDTGTLARMTQSRPTAGRTISACGNDASLTALTLASEAAVWRSSTSPQWTHADV